MKRILALVSILFLISILFLTPHAYGASIGVMADEATGTVLAPTNLEKRLEAMLLEETDTLATVASRGGFEGTETITPLLVASSLYGLNAGQGSSLVEGGRTYIGINAGTNSSGSFTFAAGYQAYANATGIYNLAIGHQALYGLVGGTNVAVGLQAGMELRGGRNSLFGQGAGQYSIGEANSYYGLSAGNRSTGDYNTAIGAGAGAQSLWSNGVAIGNYVGRRAYGSSPRVYMDSYSSDPIGEAGYSATNTAVFVDNGSVNLGRGGTLAVGRTNELRGTWNKNGKSVATLDDVQDWSRHPATNDIQWEDQWGDVSLRIRNGVYGDGGISFCNPAEGRWESFGVHNEGSFYGFRFGEDAFSGDTYGLWNNRRTDLHVNDPTATIFPMWLGGIDGDGIVTSNGTLTVKSNIVVMAGSTSAMTFLRPDGGTNTVSLGANGVMYVHVDGIMAFAIGANGTLGVKREPESNFSMVITGPVKSSSSFTGSVFYDTSGGGYIDPSGVSTMGGIGLTGSLTVTQGVSKIIPPTSAVDLPPGTLWNDGGTLKIVP